MQQQPPQPLQIVVARYNENIEWLQQLPHVIFNKGSYLKNSIKLPNVGREAHTYLKYICLNYSNLPNVIVFTQGYIGDHIPENSDPIMYLKDLAEEAKQFGISANYVDTKISPAFNIEDQEELKTKYKVINPCSEIFSDWFFDNFNFPFPHDDCKIWYGAIFALRRDKILSRSKEFYEKLMRQLEYSAAPIEAHFLERAWFYVPHHAFSQIRFYAICLQHNEQRVAKINAVKKILPDLQIVDAIDARLIKSRDIEKMKDDNFFVKRNNKYVDCFGRAYQLGGLACFLSHKKVMEMIQHQKESYAIVFEDDIALLPNFHEKMYVILQMLHDSISVDICNLYIHPQQRKNPNAPPGLLIAPPGLIGTQCLLYKQSTIQRVLNSMQKYGNPIDEQLSRDMSLNYICLSGIDLLVCDEIPSVIQCSQLKYVTI